jgi:hypothetical protein
MTPRLALPDCGITPTTSGSPDSRAQFMSSTGPRFESRFTARLVAGPFGRDDEVPDHRHERRGDQHVPTQRGCATPRMNGIARSTVPVSTTTSPAMNAMISPAPWLMASTSEGALSANHGNTSR